MSKGIKTILDHTKIESNWEYGYRTHKLTCSLVRVYSDGPDLLGFSCFFPFLCIKKCNKNKMHNYILEIIKHYIIVLKYITNNNIKYVNIINTTYK